MIFKTIRFITAPFIPLILLSFGFYLVMSFPAPLFLREIREGYRWMWYPGIVAVWGMIIVGAIHHLWSIGLDLFDDFFGR